jgi:hypothetical protein
MAAREAQIIAQKIDQGFPRLDALGHVLAVDAHADVEKAFHAAGARQRL